MHNRGRLVTQTSVGQLTTGTTVKVTSPQADAIARAVAQAGGVVRKAEGMTLHVSDIAPEDVGAISLRLGALLHELAPQNAALEDVYLVTMGCVLQAGMWQAPARQAALFAGLPDSTPAVTLNKMCGSGLEAVIQAARAVALGDASVVVAGGMESMTNAP